MAIQPTFQASEQWLVTKTVDGHDLVYFSGVAGVEFVGDTQGWRRAQLDISLPGSWSGGVLGGIAGASLAAIDNPGTGPANFGFAIDEAALSYFPPPPKVVCNIAVQDVGAKILRVSYFAIVLGRGYEPIILR